MTLYAKQVWACLSVLAALLEQPSTLQPVQSALRVDTRCRARGLSQLLWSCQSGSSCPLKWYTIGPFDCGSILNVAQTIGYILSSFYISQLLWDCQRGPAFFAILSSLHSRFLDRYTLEPRLEVWSRERCLTQYLIILDMSHIKDACNFTHFKVTIIIKQGLKHKRKLATRPCLYVLFPNNIRIKLNKVLIKACKCKMPSVLFRLKASRIIRGLGFSLSVSYFKSKPDN